VRLNPLLLLHSPVRFVVPGIRQHNEQEIETSLELCNAVLLGHYSKSFLGGIKNLFETGTTWADWLLEVRKMFGLGKRRTPLGRFLDQQRIMQKEVEKEAGVSNPIVTKACSDPNYIPSPTVQKKLLGFVRKRGWKNAKAHDLWPM
jgi:hypothetical protein